MSVLEVTKRLVRRTLELDEDEALSSDTVLLGGFAEFNSLTITNLVASIEDTFDCEIQDEELTGEIFATIDSLTRFIDAKTGGEV